MNVAIFRTLFEKNKGEYSAILGSLTKWILVFMQQSGKISDTQNDYVYAENSDNVTFDIHFLVSDFASAISEGELTLLESIVPALLLDMMQVLGPEDV